ncbi:hypothetical protein Tco_0416968 [Tanacetum coccineum]
MLSVASTIAGICDFIALSSYAEDEKSGRARIEVVVGSVVGAGVGVGVDCYGRRVIYGIVRGMVGAAVVDVFGITVTGMVRSGCV